MWRVIIIQIFTIASARRASSRQRRLPTEIAPSEYLLSAPLFVNRCLAPPPSPPPAHPRGRIRATSAAYHRVFFSLLFLAPRRLYPIVPRKRHVRSEDVIKESLEMSWGCIECMNTEFMVLAATTINNPTFVSLSSASFSYPSYVIFLPSYLSFLFLLTRLQDSVSQH